MALRPSRYYLKPPREVRVVQSNTDESAVGRRARMLDISTRGTRLRMREPIAAGEQVRVQLSLPELGVHLHLHAHARWQSLNHDGSWTVGCSIESAVPQFVFDRLAPHYCVKERGSTRESVFICGTAVWEIGDHPSRATFRDISEGGVAVFVEGDKGCGREIHICVDDKKLGQRTVHAEVIWGLTVADGSLVGCQYLNNEDYEFLRTLVSNGAYSHSCPVQGRDPADRETIT